MGREVRCAGEFEGFAGEGKLLLETDDLIFRGDKRLAVPRAQIREAKADGEFLVVAYGNGRTKQRARFAVGKGVERWVQDIVNPKSRIDKMDVKPASVVAVVGVKDADFLAEVKGRAAKVDARLGKGPYDFIVYLAETPTALGRLAVLRERLVPAGGVWVITPKGDPAMKHEVIMGAAKKAGLVDNKTARFSETHTALKLVIPRKDRKS